ncbi:putative oxidoreductase CzcO [Posidoniimonas polymericola]|uniref:Putative oxidoreductase CzcO n=1 Tax=Posidoniimonas polymericola TaxID=2528002 RepID=A0A5C5YQI8_9BACT|nr:NAD(P)-binding domain-containing protein [Posidoniimonas polymericola]TWT77109.1 putative oxidoreductase CzcO [Posidoniimonas polymericola]
MNGSTHVDYLIVGAGPAGLQLAYFLDRAGRNYMVLESRERPGGFFEKFPRHDGLLSINKVHTGYTDRETQLRYDWNSLFCEDEEMAFTKYSKEYFPSARLYAKYLQDFAAKMGLRIRYKTRVADITRCHDGPNFEVADEDGMRYSCRALIMATGMWEPWEPNIPGIETTESYADMSIDPVDFENQRVLILGKGNSAFETANHLCGATRVTHVCSPNPLKLAWKSHYVGHLRAVNNDFLDTYLLKGQNSLLDANIDRIEKRDGEYVVDLTFSHAGGQKAQLAYDRVLVCTGFKWNHNMFPASCKPESTECGRLPKMTSAWESTNLPHLFYAGTLMQMRDKHKTMSNVLHGFRSNIKSLASILAARYEGRDWPSVALARDPGAISDKIISQVSRDSSIMLQPGFLADLIVVDNDKARYYETLNVDYLQESCFAESENYFVVTMEYGDTQDDVLAVNREPDPTRAYNDVYLHPRVRQYSRGQLVAEHHISESLENDWRTDAHCGSRSLIRKLGLHGQDDPTMFQHTVREQLVSFLEGQLAQQSYAMGAM